MLKQQYPAPTTVRANSLKISRDDLLKKWEGLYEASPAKTSPEGIIFHKKINFFQLPEFKEGLFEVQDEGSQLLADLMQVKPGSKSLTIVPDRVVKPSPLLLTQGKGQIYVHDIRPSALKKRANALRRAGIQNYQILYPTSAHLSKLKKKMDWILVDAPCSGPEPCAEIPI